MYFDTAPCRVCGAAVRLEPVTVPDGHVDGPAGPPEGYVGGADQTVDDRVCTNEECPTHGDDDLEP